MPEPIPLEADADSSVDLLTVLLGLLAVMLLLGLIPLWYLVLLAWTG